MYRKDCFAYRENTIRKYCNALKDLDCQGCKFFKTHAEYMRKVAPLKYKVRKGD